MFWTTVSVLDYSQCRGLQSVSWTTVSVLDYSQCSGLQSVLWTTVSVLDVGVEQAVVFRCSLDAGFHQTGFNHKPATYTSEEGQEKVNRSSSSLHRPPLISAESFLLADFSPESLSEGS